MILKCELNGVQLRGKELKHYRHKKRILSLLYQHKTLSASYVAQSLGLSLPTAISFFKQLSTEGLIEPRGAGESRGGRKPKLFGLKGNALIVAVCEVGRYHAKVAMYNSHNQLMASIEHITTNINDRELIEKINETITKICHNINIEKGMIRAIGITMPGLVNEESGYNYTINEESLQNVKKRAQEIFNCLVYVNNDARMQAYGEFVFGEARGFNCALVINWSWGLGLGIIFNGELYNGATGFAGEFSHIRIKDSGELCSCGKRGCLETVASVNTLLHNARKAIREKNVSQLSLRFLGNEESLSIKDIMQAAKQGDELSISLLNELGLNMGKSLANIIQLLNPDVIVLGGIIAEARQYILTPISQSINHYCLEKISVNTKIVVSENWEEAGLLGTTAMLYEKLLDHL